MTDVRCADHGRNDRWERQDECPPDMAKEMNEAMEAVAHVFDEKGDIYAALARGACQADINKEIAEYYEAKADAVEEIGDLFEAMAGRATRLLDLLDGDENFSCASEAAAESAGDAAHKKRAEVLSELNDAMGEARDALEAVQDAVAEGKCKEEIEALIAEAMEKIGDAHGALGGVSELASEGGEIAEGLESTINASTAALEDMQAQLEYESERLDGPHGSGGSGSSGSVSDNDDHGSPTTGVAAWSAEELAELREIFHRYVGIPGIANELIAELLTNPELSSLLDAMHGDPDLIKGMANQGAELGVLFGTWAEMSVTERTEILDTLRGGPKDSAGNDSDNAVTDTSGSDGASATDDASGSGEYRGISIPAEWQGAPIEQLFQLFEERMSGTAAHEAIERLFSDPGLSSLLDRMYAEPMMSSAIAWIAATDPARFDMLLEQWPSMDYQGQSMATMLVFEFQNATGYGTSNGGTVTERGIEIPAQWAGKPIETLFAAFESQLSGTEAHYAIGSLFARDELSSLWDRIYADPMLGQALAWIAKEDPQRFNDILEQWPTWSGDYMAESMATGMWKEEYRMAA